MKVSLIKLVFLRFLKAQKSWGDSSSSDPKKMTNFVAFLLKTA